MIATPTITPTTTPTAIPTIDAGSAAIEGMQMEGGGMERERKGGKRWGRERRWAGRGKRGGER